MELMKLFEPLPEDVISDKEDPFVAMKFKLSPPLFFQCILHATDICDKNSMSRKGVEVVETAFKHNNETVNHQR